MARDKARIAPCPLPDMRLSGTLSVYVEVDNGLDTMSAGMPHDMIIDSSRIVILLRVKLRRS